MASASFCSVTGSDLPMHRSAYDKRAWRELPREKCVLESLFGEAAGPCSGTIHRHHLNPADPASRSVEVCAAHHPRLQAILRRLLNPEWKRCPHKPGTHRYREGLEACERQLNRDLIRAA